MKRLPLLLSALAMLFMASCTSPIAKRIERNPDIYNGLSQGHKNLVQQGLIQEGMTKKAVFLAWGRPDRVSKGEKSGSTYEKWSYASYEPVYTSGLGFNSWSSRAYHRGYYSYDRALLYEPMMSYVPYEAGRVEFLNGIVTAWSASR